MFLWVRNNNAIFVTKQGDLARGEIARLYLPDDSIGCNFQLHVLAGIWTVWDDVAFYPTRVPAKWHLNSSNRLSRGHEYVRRQKDRPRCGEMCRYKRNRMQRRPLFRILIVCQYSKPVSVGICVSVYTRTECAKKKLFPKCFGYFLNNLWKFWSTILHVYDVFIITKSCQKAFCYL